MVTSRSSPRLSLLGGLSLEVQGAAAGAAGQRKKLALLAVLAVQGAARPVSRERLMALLWPEADQERARNSLKQTMSALRRELGDAIFLGEQELRLNPSSIDCDVWDFEGARSAGQHEKAVAVFRGPFLDGVHLRDGHELEEWAGRERMQLAVAHQDSLEQLARGCEMAGDLRGAVGWWRRLAAQDPLSTRGAVGLVSALAASGEAAEALRHAAIHEQLVRDELGAELGGELADLVRRLRAGEDLGAWAVAPGPVIAGSLPDYAGAVVQGTPAATAEVLHRGSVGANRWRPMLLASIAALGVIFVLGSWLMPNGRRPLTTGGAVELDSKKVLVAYRPSSDPGDTDAEDDAIGNMVADWISRGLLQTRLVTVAPGGLLARPSAGGVRESGLDPALIETARYAGAGLIVAASHRRLAGEPHLEAQIIDVTRLRVVRSVNPVPMPEGDPLAGAEALRQRVLAALAPLVDPRMANWADAASQPTNFEAYQAYAEGLAAYFDRSRSRDWNVYFKRAHELDTAFTTPLVWTFFRGTENWIRCYLVERREKLPPWDRGVLDFFIRPSNEAGYQAWKRVVAAAPQSEWLYMLGWAAIDANRPAVAVRALEALDPNRGWMREWPSYWSLLGRAYHDLEEYEAQLSVVREGRQRFPHHLGLFVSEIEVLAALGRNEEAELASVGLSYKSPVVSGGFPNFERTVLELRRHGATDVAKRLTDRLLTELEALGGPLQTRFQVLWAVGRWEAAAPLLDSLLKRSPKDGGLLSGRALLAASRGNREEAERVAAQVPESGTDHPPESCGGPANPGRLSFLRAMIHAQLGEFDVAVEHLQVAGQDRRNPWQMHLMEPDGIHSYAPFVDYKRRHYDDPEVFPAARHR